MCVALQVLVSSFVYLWALLLEPLVGSHNVSSSSKSSAKETLEDLCRQAVGQDRTTAVGLDTGSYYVSLLIIDKKHEHC